MDCQPIAFCDSALDDLEKISGDSTGRVVTAVNDSGVAIVDAVSANAATIDSAIGLAVVELNAAIAALGADIDLAFGLATTTITGAISVQTAGLISAINNDSFKLPGQAFLRYNTRYQMDTNYSTITFPPPYESIEFIESSTGVNGVITSTDNLSFKLYRGESSTASLRMRNLSLPLPAVLPTPSFSFEVGNTNYTYFIVVGRQFN
ncbi:hypothetical protein [Ceratitis capitata nodavirus 1]|nr:hypothetical protein [Ceratitis capitata nodavirus 1]